MTITTKFLLWHQISIHLYKQVIEFKSYFDIFAFSHRKSFLGVLGQICREDLDPWLWAIGFSVHFYILNFPFDPCSILGQLSEASGLIGQHILYPACLKEPPGVTFGVFQMDYWLTVCVSEPWFSALLGLAALTWELSRKGHGSLLECLFTSDLQIWPWGSRMWLTLPMQKIGRCDLCYVRVEAVKCVCVCTRARADARATLDPIQGHKSWSDFIFYQDIWEAIWIFQAWWQKAKEIVLSQVSALYEGSETDWTSDWWILAPVNSEQILCLDLALQCLCPGSWLLT